MDIKTLQSVGNKFRLAGTIESFKPITSGIINSTYKVDYIMLEGSKKSFIFQRVNTFVFKSPSEIMENIDRVTEHIRQKYPDETTLHFHHTDSGANYYERSEKEFWRIINYFESVSYDSSDDMEVIKNTGMAFGNFQHQISDFDASLLHETIPDFHNTKKRLDKLFADEKEDIMGRAAEIKPELDFMHEYYETATALTDMYASGKFPPRVTHNDTKSNNVLFDKSTKLPLVVIDLDTVMPGMAMYDFGDGARFIASTSAEDEKNLSKVSLDLKKFKAFAEGFIPCVKDSLTQLEIENMALGTFSVTVELASRFLDDYLTGDRYFRVDYPGHNLVRARCQIKLAKDMLAKKDEMLKIINDIMSE